MMTRLLHRLTCSLLLHLGVALSAMAQIPAVAQTVGRMSELRDESALSQVEPRQQQAADTKDSIVFISDTLEIRFESGSSVIDMEYDGNGDRWNRFWHNYKRHAFGKKRQDILLDIYAGASPDGSPALNQRLAAKRGESISTLIHSQLDDLVGLIVHNEGPRWNALDTIIQASSEYWKDEVLAILRQPAMTDANGRDHRENLLRKMYEGWVWYKLKKYYFPQLRTAGSAIVTWDAVSIIEPPAPAETIGRKTFADNFPLSAIPDSLDWVTPNSTILKGYGRWHLRTNLIYDAVLLPNIGIEYGLKSNVSLVLNAGGNWLRRDKRHRYWRMFTADFEYRRWLGNRTGDVVLQHRGHHIGVYAAVYRYDLEFGGKGHMGDFNFGGGISYGYSAPIGRRLSLDMSLGVGYVGGKYKLYEPRDDGRYYWLSDETRAWFGPTKAEVTLVWHIGRYR